MPERELLPTDDTCGLSARWGVIEDVIRRVNLAAFDYIAETGGQVWIISGFRTAEEQRRLQKAGRPTAPDELSTHRSCPATGIDVALGFAPTRVQKAIWGRIVTLQGLRWGGGGAVDEGGIPIDWGHVDLGPRS